MARQHYRANTVVAVAVLVQLALCATCGLSLRLRDDPQQQLQEFQLSRVRRSSIATNRDQEDELANRALPVSRQTSGNASGVIGGLEPNKRAANRCTTNRCKRHALSGGKLTDQLNDLTPKDLIALASADKNLERKLVRMILDRIQATPPSYSDFSLTQQLARMQLGQQQQYEWPRSDASNDFLAGGDQTAASFGQRLRSMPLINLINSGELEAAAAAAAGPDSNSLVDQVQQQQSPAQLGGGYPSGQLSKREYRIKACSFNAVSCAKNPFRSAAKI